MGSKEPVHPPDTRDLTRDTSESGPRGLEQTAEVGETLRASPGAGGAFLPHGSWLDKSYRVKDLLGRGAMGAVYLVEHVELGKEFAAKVVAGAHGLDPAAITRLRNEARMASSIDHENIVGVSHLGTLPDGSVFVVMERLRGEDLRARMERRRAAGDPWLPDDEVRAIVPPLLSALASAHAAGIVHRDLKPDNIFLHHRRGLITPKIVDFGIGKLRNAEEDLRLTATGQIIGTPLYMAPEQSRSSDIVDHRTDLYSMGVVLYELLTGRLPFDAKSLYELVVKHVTETPPDPRTLRADLPDPVAELLLRCLQKAPDARPQTADELSRAWREAWGEPAGLPAAPSFPASGELGLYESGAHEGGLGSSPRFDSANEATTPALATSQSVTAQIADARPAPAPARGRGRVAVAGVAALVVTLALGIWLVGAEGEDVGAPAPTAAPIAAETTAARASTSASDELVRRDELARSPSSALAPTEGVSPGARADDDA
ncbi:MAG: serine/threonine protein kinase, partial [Myxococcales bacterium]|nr:serine/threonine protein kinase [Myxococcales bacterium]